MAISGELRICELRIHLHISNISCFRWDVNPQTLLQASMPHKHLHIHAAIKPSLMLCSWIKDLTGFSVGIPCSWKSLANLSKHSCCLPLLRGSLFSMLRWCALHMGRPFLVHTFQTFGGTALSWQVKCTTVTFSRDNVCLTTYSHGVRACDCHTSATAHPSHAWDLLIPQQCLGPGPSRTA